MWTHLCCECGKLLGCAALGSLELPVADHVGGFNPSAGGAGRMEGLKAHHRAGDQLYKSTILLKDSVQIFDLADLDCAATAKQ